jgi:hypothetical protein
VAPDSTPYLAQGKVKSEQPARLATPFLQNFRRTVWPHRDTPSSGCLYYIALVMRMSITEPVGTQISTKGRYVIYGLSFMSGFAVSHVLDRLNAVSKQVFKVQPEGK